MTSFEQIQHTHLGPASPLRKIVTFIMTLAIIGLALMFSAILLVVLLTIGAIAGCYLWWKTRSLRKQVREHAKDSVIIDGMVIDSVVVDNRMASKEVFEGEIIEGEVISRIDSDSRKDH